MDETAGSLGTAGSLSLRLGQALFSSASLLFMSIGVEFYSYTAFWQNDVDSADSCDRCTNLCKNSSTVLVSLFCLVVILINHVHHRLPLFLVTIMGLVIPWSATLAAVDIYSFFGGCPLRMPGVMVIVVVGDWVLSILSLAAACATASVMDLLVHIDGSYCPPKFCSRYQLSAAMAFLSWFLTAASSLFNLWILAAL